MFVLHAAIGCGIVAGTMLYEAQKIGLMRFVNTNILCFAVMVFSAMLTNILGILFSFHIYLISGHLSTLEKNHLGDESIENPYNNIR